MSGSAFGVGLFRDELGFTTVGMATALLVSLALTFAVVGAGWTASRAGDVQAVADAAALAGEDMVAAYTTIAQVLDACVLSLGLLGVIVMAVGLVLTIIPPIAEAGMQMVSWAQDLLQRRAEFARRCMEGLRRLEELLPGLVVFNSAAVVSANAGETLHYAGCAVPYPTESQSDLGALDDGLNGDDLASTADELREAAAKAEEAKRVADKLQEAGWQADCAAEPHCLYERAAQLADLSPLLNPLYDSPDLWNFGVPLNRARTYYAARLAAEGLGGGDDVEQTRAAACRRAFYAFALRATSMGSYEEQLDGQVLACELPSLPRNPDEMRATTLYTDPLWPTSIGPAGTVLHASASCPACTGIALPASLQMQEAGLVGECEVCHMSSYYLGQVASATTNVGTGFEYWWAQVVEASQGYQEARNEQLQAEEELRDAQSKANEYFQAALELLGCPRPRLCPPGAYGCIGIVLREGGARNAAGSSAFAAPAELPAGAAISGATLAPDEATQDNDVLSSFFDAVVGPEGELSLGGVLDGVVSLWATLLKGYGALSQRLGEAADNAFGAMELVPGLEFSRAIRRRISDVIDAGGFAPADLRLRKPVLVNTAQIAAKAGVAEDDIRATLLSLPAGAGPIDVARAFALHYIDTGDIPEEVVVAELPVPGREEGIPLTVNLRELVAGDAA